MSHSMSRATAVHRMRARLLRDGFPRVQMFILVSLTGLAGSGASALMLLTALETMPLRYALVMEWPTSPSSALGLLLSSLFVVWTAPVLFAEILVDALLVAGLYRRLRGLERQHWMVAALKRTVIPFVLTTVLVAGAGWGMGAYAPEARSIGDVLAHQ